MDINVEQVKSLIELMVSNDLSRIEIREGDGHLLLRRGQQVIAGPAHLAAPMMAPAYAPMPAAAPAGPNVPGPAASLPGGAESRTQAAPTENEILIKSPMVGTYYASPEPDAPPFVAIGNTIGPNSVVCLVEAMKVFNEIKAEVSGRISKILVKSGQAVEFDQPLFAVAPA